MRTDCNLIVQSVSMVQSIHVRDYRTAEERNPATQFCRLHTCRAPIDITTSPTKRTSRTLFKPLHVSFVMIEQRRSETITWTVPFSSAWLHDLTLRPVWSERILLASVATGDRFSPPFKYKHFILVGIVMASFISVQCQIWRHKISKFTWTLGFHMCTWAVLYTAERQVRRLDEYYDTSMGIRRSDSLHVLNVVKMNSSIIRSRPWIFPLDSHAPLSLVIIKWRRDESICIWSSLYNSRPAYATVRDVFTINRHNR